MVMVEINENSKQAKAVIAMLKAFDFVKFINKEKPQQKSPYNPEFVKKVKKAEQEIKEGKTIRINPKDVWGSIGLK